MPSRPYILLIATGQTPQVITETVFQIYQNEDRLPAGVHVVTTRVGHAYGRALLFGESLQDPERGVPIEGAANRWETFCDDILGREVDVEFHVPAVENVEISDIREAGDDTRFANLCYRLVERCTREDALPLVGSIAGGRKTMSAHLMTAFSVYARPEDRLTHVLLTDPDLEHDRSFFYPEPGHPRFNRLLDLVDIRFPRIRSLLEADVIDGLPEDRRDLQGILDVLEPHITSTRSVSTVTLELTDRRARLVFDDNGETLDTCNLTPKQASTLAVFAEHRAQTGDSVPAPRFVDNEVVETQRAQVAFLCSEDPMRPWTSSTDVSKAFHDLKSALDAVPLAARLLSIEGLSSRPRRYDWPENPPPLLVASRYPNEDWPFDALAPLEPIR
jgi:CRISPR-associated protein (TIGR02584 family)